MAEALGNLVCKKKPDGGEQGDEGDDDDFGITIEQFRETFGDELMDLVNDSDNLVKIKSLEAVAKLCAKNHATQPDPSGSYIAEKVLREEIVPHLLKFMEAVLEDEESTMRLMHLLGQILHLLSHRFRSLVLELQP
mmetsp:Transcript_16750/g.28456  ORF Transcript_16750/g.28456 Transcript_16750/m.28456 type:complete len:136 (+) Transcript_16750:685-1092(+)